MTPEFKAHIDERKQAIEDGKAARGGASWELVGNGRQIGSEQGTQRKADILDQAPARQPSGHDRPNQVPEQRQTTEAGDQASTRTSPITQDKANALDAHPTDPRLGQRSEGPPAASDHRQPTAFDSQVAAQGRPAVSDDRSTISGAPGQQGPEGLVPPRDSLRPAPEFQAHLDERKAAIEERKAAQGGPSYELVDSSGAWQAKSAPGQDQRPPNPDSDQATPKNEQAGQTGRDHVVDPPRERVDEAPAPSAAEGPGARIDTTAGSTEVTKPAASVEEQLDVVKVNRGAGDGDGGRFVEHHTPVDEDVMKDRLQSLDDRDELPDRFHDVESGAIELNNSFRSGSFDIMQTDGPQSFYRAVQASPAELADLRASSTGEGDFSAKLDDLLRGKAVAGPFYTSEAPAGHRSFMDQQAVAPEWRLGGVNYTSNDGDVARTQVKAPDGDTYADHDGYTAVVKVDVPEGQEYFRGKAAPQGLWRDAPGRAEVHAHLLGGGEQVVMLTPKVTDTSIDRTWGQRPTFQDDQPTDPQDGSPRPKIGERAVHHVPEEEFHGRRPETTPTMATGVEQRHPEQESTDTSVDRPERSEVLEAARALADRASEIRPSKARPAVAEAVQLPTGEIYEATSVRGPAPELHPDVQEILDEIPNEDRAAGHGHCGFVVAVSDALNDGHDPTGSVAAAVIVRSTVDHEDHGAVIEPCGSCKPVAETFDIAFEEA